MMPCYAWLLSQFILILPLNDYVADADGACKTSSQRTRARATRGYTILIAIKCLLPIVSQITDTKLLTSCNKVF